MNAWIDDLRRFVASPNPRFLCHDTDGPRPGVQPWTAALMHHLAGPGSDASLEALRRSFNDAPPRDFIEFYSRHDGAILYEDTLENTAGFRTCGLHIAPIAAWGELKAGLHAWVELLDEDEAEDLLPPWFDVAVPFAEVPNSGNYFLALPDRSGTAQIVYFDHDGFEFEVFARDLPEFFAKAMSEPATLLSSLGCHARYADGTTHIQWIPRIYLTGVEPA